MSRSKTTYDAYQQAFYIGNAVNRAHFLKGKEKDLQKQLENEVAAVLGDARVVEAFGKWDVVWGPVVWQHAGSDVADNAMYVAHSAATNTYVVGIAGTNGPSGYDWQSEDLAVKRVVRFDGFDPFSGREPQETAPVAGAAFISKATANGVWRLAEMTPPGGRPGARKNISGFLQGLSSVGTSTVVFVGHSLAGALSPTLALWLKTHKKLDSFGAVATYPTAGPTPGNEVFAAAYATSFALTPSTAVDAPSFRTWNRVVWNSLDVVPHAWNLDTLAQVNTLYGAPAPDQIQRAMTRMTALSSDSGIAYTQLPNVCLEGHIVPPAPSGTGDAYKQAWIHQAGAQHTTEYPTLLGIQLIEVTVPLVDGVTLMTKEEIERAIKAWFLIHDPD